MEIKSEAFVFKCTLSKEGSTCEYHDKGLNYINNEANVKMESH